MKSLTNVILEILLISDLIACFFGIERKNYNKNFLIVDQLKQNLLKHNLSDIK